MENNKKSLKTALVEVINALEKDCIHYDWRQQGSCNCGLVVQALLNKNSNEVKSLFHQERHKTIIDSIKDKDANRTWKDVAKRRCNVTGLPMEGIFTELYAHGFRAEDIVHLEFLENKTILKESGINTKESAYHTDPKNLVLYLKSWLKILNEKSSDFNEINNKEDLEKEMLRAVEREDYPTAAKIRDKISVLA